MFDQQLKHVLRRLMRSPMFAAITLATLAIGIGASPSPIRIPKNWSACGTQPRASISTS
jgi:hypothetical protein